VYRAGSVSKTFTGLAIMKLYEEGIIDLDAPITDYLPDFSMKTRFPDSDPITIRSIMSHRSGLADPENRFLGEYTGLEPFERISLGEIVDSLEDDYVAYPVGYRFNYSTSGFALLGRIIEVMTGHEYSDYMQENVFTPLGMNDSSFFSSSVEEGKMATGYYCYNNITLALPIYDYSNLGGAGLYSTLNDMTKYLKFLLREGAVNGNQLIKQETLEMMYADTYSRPRDPMAVGLTWGLFPLSSGHIFVAHGGSILGFETFMGFFPEEKLGFIIMVNVMDAIPMPLGTTILELMLESKYGIKPLKENTPEAVHVDRETLEQYTGKYSFGSIIEIRLLNNNTLQLIEQSGIKANLIPITEKKFRLSLPPLLEKIIGQGTLEFFVGDEDEEDVLILDLQLSPMDIFCPRLPKVEEIPPIWNELVGEYTVETSYIEKVLATLEVKIVDGVLTAVLTNTTLPDHPTKEPIPMIFNPINDTEILIVGGMYFAGATFFYDNDTGYITGGGMIMKPKD
jgi:CubicO group peptidase (beta-lactamase class C family)